ncbi:MAG TPA: DegT/DnrJ/EryC1/StrS family aminotransferase [Burkholderiales bacterium]|nr:DegT/DnrJ/EryC1/StrS family aminotransferase [Burkholderiales bacterium]
MIVRKKLDIGWTDIAFGLGACLLPGDAQAAQKRVEEAWSPAGDAIACLSVRTGFDLLLSALALRAGSEILVSAITISDMVRIIERHGLVAVPIDLDIATLSIRAELISDHVTARTKAIVVAHLFGSRMAMEPISAVARRHGLLVIEDCAQAFAADGYRGSAHSDVSMFSFGPIKTATALGGALLRVRDAGLRTAMRARQRDYPAQRRSAYVRKLVKCAALKVLSYRLPYGLFAACCSLLQTSHDAIIGQAARSFAGTELFRAIRQRPCYALMALLRRRLVRFDARSIAMRIAAARAAASYLPGVQRPGDQAVFHTHWVFPIRSSSPDELLRRLWQSGFDATRGASSLYVVPAPPGNPGTVATEAARAMDNMVYLPVHPGLAERHLKRLGDTISGFETATSSSEEACRQFASRFSARS